MFGSCSCFSYEVFVLWVSSMRRLWLKEAKYLKRSFRSYNKLVNAGHVCRVPCMWPNCAVALLGASRRHPPCVLADGSGSDVSVKPMFHVLLLPIITQTHRRICEGDKDRASQTCESDRPRRFNGLKIDRPNLRQASQALSSAKLVRWCQVCV